MSYFSKFVRTVGPLGGYALARFLTRNQPRILMYHRYSEQAVRGHISADAFRVQLDYIQRKYNAVSLSDLAACLSGEQSLPPNAIVITVDDGYQDFYNIAFPMLRERNLPATIFATTGFIDGDVWLWPDKMHYLLQQCSCLYEDIQIQNLYVQSGEIAPSDKAALWGKFNQFLLSIPDDEKHQAIARIYKAFRLEMPVKAPEGFEACTWDQLGEMQENGISIGAHTVTHPSLGRVSDDQAYSEITGSLNRLDECLGKRMRSFCYPNGTPADYNPAIMDMVKQAGFDCSVVAHSDSAALKDIFALRRHAVGEDMFQFYKSVSGVELLGHIARSRNNH